MNLKLKDPTNQNSSFQFEKNEAGDLKKRWRYESRTASGKKKWRSVDSLLSCIMCKLYVNKTSQYVCKTKLIF
jgi:hypothetical protein